MYGLSNTTEKVFVVFFPPMNGRSVTSYFSDFDINVHNDVLDITKSFHLLIWTEPRVKHGEAANHSKPLGLFQFFNQAVFDLDYYLILSINQTVCYL